ncbi:MAG: site-specific integrase [Chlamydiota bacterium]
MMLIPVVVENPIALHLETYEQATCSNSTLFWKKLDEISVEEAISSWLPTLSSKTQLSYRSGIKKLVELGWLNPSISLQEFALTNHDSVIDRIKLFQNWAETTRQARAACYISFTGFLSNRFEGALKKAIPNREGQLKTFFNVYEKVKTHAMTQVQWITFFEELDKLNPRDSLIGKVILQGGKKVNEVLTLQTSQINWDRCEIVFTQSKIKGRNKQTVITYSEGIIKKLRDYVGNRTGYVFMTRSCKPVMINQLAITFAKAGKAAGIPFKVSPQVLRASTVTYLKQQGFQDADIMRVTGHSTLAMVCAYDKSSSSDNVSKKINLIS